MKFNQGSRMLRGYSAFSRCLAVLIVWFWCAGSVLAAGWAHVPAQNLAGLKLNYGEAWQDFRNTGRTLYNAGEDSWGYWREEGGRYCSQWPPGNEWTCYDVERNGNEIRFIDDSGQKTIGVIE